jgi:hypothetical protein
METAGFSEKSLPFYKTKRRHIQEDSNLHIHNLEISGEANQFYWDRPVSCRHKKRMHNFLREIFLKYTNMKCGGFFRHHLNFIALECGPGKLLNRKADKTSGSMKTDFP